MNYTSRSFAVQYFIITFFSSLFAFAIQNGITGDDNNKMKRR